MEKKSKLVHLYYLCISNKYTSLRIHFVAHNKYSNQHTHTHAYEQGQLSGKGPDS